MTLPVLCADDFAMSDGITHAVEKLADDARLSATSAIVTGPRWNDHRRRIPPLRTTLAVGLHLSLTWGAPRTRLRAFAPAGVFPSLRTLIARALLGALPVEEIAAEFQRQIDVFQDATGEAPDFIDGHEHVHALPTIRTALLTALDRSDNDRSWIIRAPGDTPRAIIARNAPAKATVVAALTSGFTSVCERDGHRTNNSFAGFSSFSPSVDHGLQLRRAFARAASRHLIMCHPSSPTHPALTGDPIAAARLREFDAIASAEWLPLAIWRKETPQSPLWGAR